MKIIIIEIKSREFLIIINFKTIINRKIALIIITNISVNLYTVIKNILRYYNANYNVSNKYFIEIYNITALINDSRNIDYNRRGILV